MTFRNGVFLVLTVDRGHLVLTVGTRCLVPTVDRQILYDGPTVGTRYPRSDRGYLVLFS